MSAGRPAHVTCSTCGMCSNSSPRRVDTGRPAEVVDRERVDPVLGEAERELLVVGMQAADVGEDHDPGAGHLRRAGPERPEPVAVLRLEHQLGRVERAAGDRDDRRTGIEIEAHAASTSAVEGYCGRRDGRLVAPGAGRPEATGAGGRMRRCLPRRSSSRSSAAPASPTRTGSGGSRGGSRASAPQARTSSSIVSAMGDTTDELLGLAAAITDKPDERELDMLLATGEHQSATLVSMALHALGVPAISLSGPQAGITTDGRYGRARIASIEPDRVRRELDGGKVVIVAGFQGRAEGERRRAAPTSRPSAAAAATRRRSRWPPASAPHRCQIFTDVRGIYTADPRIVPDARQLPVIGYEEMLELAHQGAQVMQTRAVELGWVNDVVIEVLSSFEDAPGTLIKEDPLVEQRNKVRGLAHDRNVAKVTLVDVPDRPGVAAHVFGPLADAGDQRRHDRPEHRPRRRDRPELHDPAGRARRRRSGSSSPVVPRARVPRAHDGLVGRQGVDRRRRASTNAPGYAARMFGTLADAGVNIEMISTSEIRITSDHRRGRPRDRPSRRSTRRSSSSGPDSAAVDAGAERRPASR